MGISWGVPETPQLAPLPGDRRQAVQRRARIAIRLNVHFAPKATELLRGREMTRCASNRQVAVARDALYFGRTHLNLRDILWSYVRSPNAITHYGIVPSHSTGAPFARAEFSANHHALFGRVRATRVESDAY